MDKDSIEYQAIQNAFREGAYIAMQMISSGKHEVKIKHMWDISLTKAAIEGDTTHYANNEEVKHRIYQKVCALDTAAQEARNAPSGERG